jgi:hypothetical protein
MFRAIFSPIIRSTWLYLHYLLVFTQIAAGWCLWWVETELCRLWGVYTELWTRVMFSPIIRSTWLYLHYLVMFTQVAAGWCLEWYRYENSQQDALYRLIYYSKSAVHVSGDVSAHHQEHMTVFTISPSVHPSCWRLVSWMSWNCI